MSARPLAIDPAPNYHLANVFAVPRTGKWWNGGRSRHYRGPRNIAVKKAILGLEGTLRGQKVPPHNYMDITLASNYDRNWKRFRKTRWHRIAAA